MGTKKNDLTNVEKGKSPNVQKVKDTKKVRKIPEFKRIEIEKRELLRNDLIDQLQSLGKFSKYHEDLINDYMFFWDLKNKIQRNINKSGLMVTVITGNGFAKKIINPNVKEIREVNSSMMRILKELDIQQTSDSGDDVNDSAKHGKL